MVSNMVISKAANNNIQDGLNDQTHENSFKERHILKILSVLNENLSRSNNLHRSFLEQQAQALQAITAASSFQTSGQNTKNPVQPVITKAQLEEFSTGSIAKCFGPNFKILDKRRSPRIPNGDLLMIDRVISINGERRNLNPPASITTEFHISNDIWFIKENIYPGVPLSMLMEIALQPCGILSAYLGTSLVLPAEINIFRNLDGKIYFLSNPRLSGKTITNHSKLLASFSNGGMLIQNYAFELSVAGTVFLAGESSFGYFSQTAMEQQTGLDMTGDPVPPFGNGKNHGESQQEGYPSISLPNLDTKNGHLNLTDTMHLYKNTGRYANGLITGEKNLNGSEWFYTNHFFEDPVMPGSLGLEAVIQGVWAYAKYLQLDVNISKSSICFSHNDPFIWKYRGQVIPANRKIKFHVHIKTKNVTDSVFSFTGDADFWVDGMKIYSFQNISMALKEG